MFQNIYPQIPRRSGANFVTTLLRGSVLSVTVGCSQCGVTSAALSTYGICGRWNLA